MCSSRERMEREKEEEEKQSVKVENPTKLIFRVRIHGPLPRIVFAKYNSPEAKGAIRISLYRGWSLR